MAAHFFALFFLRRPAVATNWSAPGPRSFLASHTTLAANSAEDAGPLEPAQCVQRKQEGEPAEQLAIRRVCRQRARKQQRAALCLCHPRLMQLVNSSPTRLQAMRLKYVAHLLRWFYWRLIPPAASSKRLSTDYAQDFAASNQKLVLMGRSIGKKPGARVWTTQGCTLGLKGIQLARPEFCVNLHAHSLGNHSLQQVQAATCFSIHVPEQVHKQRAA